MLQAQEILRGSKARVDVERSTLLPQVSFVVRDDKGEEENSRLDEIESSSARVQLSMSVYSGGLDQSRTRQSKINAERAQSQVDSQRLETIAGVVKAWNRLEATKRAVRAETDQVSANETAVSGIKRERGLGLRTTIARFWQPKTP